MISTGNKKAKYYTMLQFLVETPGIEPGSEWNLVRTSPYTVVI